MEAPRLDNAPTLPLLFLRGPGLSVLFLRGPGLSARFLLGRLSDFFGLCFMGPKLEERCFTGALLDAERLTGACLIGPGLADRFFIGPGLDVRFFSGPKLDGRFFTGPGLAARSISVFFLPVRTPLPLELVRLLFVLTSSSSLRSSKPVDLESVLGALRILAPARFDLARPRVVLVEVLCSLTPKSSVRFVARFLVLCSLPSISGSVVRAARLDPEVVRLGLDEVELCSLIPRSFLSFLPKLTRLAISSSKSSVNFPKAASMADLFRTDVRLEPLAALAAISFFRVESSTRIDVSDMEGWDCIVISMDTAGAGLANLLSSDKNFGSLKRFLRIQRSLGVMLAIMACDFCLLPVSQPWVE